MAQVFPEEDLAVKSEFSPEVRALARRIYDENRYYVPIASGMVNQVYRNGFLTKKTIDGDRLIRMEGSKNYYPEYVEP